MVKQYVNPRGLRILQALDDLAATHRATPAQIALAWLIARPGLTAPIVSATSVTQLHDVLAAAQLSLSADQIAQLDAASAPSRPTPPDASACAAYAVDHARLSARSRHRGCAPRSRTRGPFRKESP